MPKGSTTLRLNSSAVMLYKEGIKNEVPETPVHLLLPHVLHNPSVLKSSHAADHAVSGRCWVWCIAICGVVWVQSSGRALNIWNDWRGLRLPLLELVGIIGDRLRDVGRPEGELNSESGLAAFFI